MRKISKEKASSYKRFIRISILVATLSVIASIGLLIYVFHGMEEEKRLEELAVKTSIDAQQTPQQTMTEPVTNPATKEPATQVPTDPGDSDASVITTAEPIVIHIETTPEPTTPEPTTPEPTTPEPTTPEPGPETPAPQTRPVSERGYDPLPPIPDGPEVLPDLANTIFIGDSRTKTMSHGGKLEFGLVPDDHVFAIWGGQLDWEECKICAREAGKSGAAAVVFWFGVNDVQMYPNRDDPMAFIRNYRDMVEEYINAGGKGRMYFMSILTTQTTERDYYVGQEENIAAWNAALKQFCEENGKGYYYLDITHLYSGRIFCDNVHFAKWWYEESLLPYLREVIR